MATTFSCLHTDEWAELQEDALGKGYCFKAPLCEGRSNMLNSSMCACMPCMLPRFLA